MADRNEEEGSQGSQTPAVRAIPQAPAVPESLSNSNVFNLDSFFAEDLLGEIADELIWQSGLLEKISGRLSEPVLVKDSSQSTGTLSRTPTASPISSSRTTRQDVSGGLTTPASKTADNRSSGVAKAQTATPASEEKLSEPARIPIAPPPAQRPDSTVDRQASAVKSEAAKTPQQNNQEEKARRDQAREASAQKRLQQTQTQATLDQTEKNTKLLDFVKKLGITTSKSGNENRADVVGQILGGPLYETGRELYDLVSDIRIKNPLAKGDSKDQKAKSQKEEKARQEGKQRDAKGRYLTKERAATAEQQVEATNEIKETLEDQEKAEKRRHRKLVKAVDDSGYSIVLAVLLSAASKLFGGKRKGGDTATSGRDNKNKGTGADTKKPDTKTDAKPDTKTQSKSQTPTTKANPTPSKPTGQPTRMIGPAQAAATGAAAEKVNQEQKAKQESKQLGKGSQVVQKTPTEKDKAKETAKAGGQSARMAKNAGDVAKGTQAANTAKTAATAGKAARTGGMLARGGAMAARGAGGLLLGSNPLGWLITAGLAGYGAYDAVNTGDYGAAFGEGTTGESATLGQDVMMGTGGALEMLSFGLIKAETTAKYLNDLPEKLTGVFDDLPESFSAGAATVGAALSTGASAVGKAWTDGTTVVKGAFTEGSTFVSNAVTGVGTTISGALATGTAAIGGAWASGTEFIDESFQAGSLAVTTAVGTVGETISGAWTAGQTTISEAFSAGSNVVSTAVSGIGESVSGIGEEISTSFTEAISGISSTASLIGDAFSTGASTVQTTIEGALANPIESLADITGSYMETVTFGQLDADRVSGIIQEGAATLEENIQASFAAVSELRESSAATLSGIWDKTTAELGSWFSTSTEEVKAATTDNIGKTSESLAVTADTLRASAEGFLSAATASAALTLGNISSSFDTQVTSIQATANRAVESTTGFLATTAQRISDSAEGTLDEALGFISGVFSGSKQSVQTSSDTAQKVAEESFETSSSNITSTTTSVFSSISESLGGLTGSVTTMGTTAATSILASLGLIDSQTAANEAQYKGVNESSRVGMERSRMSMALTTQAVENTGYELQTQQGILKSQHSNLSDAQSTSLLNQTTLVNTLSDTLEGTINDLSESVGNLATSISDWSNNQIATLKEKASSLAEGALNFLGLGEDEEAPSEQAQAPPTPTPAKVEGKLVADTPIPEVNAILNKGMDKGRELVDAVGGFWDRMVGSTPEKSVEAIKEIEPRIQGLSEKVSDTTEIINEKTAELQRIEIREKEVKTVIPEKTSQTATHPEPSLYIDDQVYQLMITGRL